MFKANAPTAHLSNSILLKPKKLIFNPDTPDQNTTVLDLTNTGVTCSASIGTLAIKVNYLNTSTGNLESTPVQYFNCEDSFDGLIVIK